MIKIYEHNSIKKREFIFLLVIISTSFSIPFSLIIKVVIGQERKDLTGINVAIYDYTGIIDKYDQINALTSMFGWMNATVGIINITQVLNGGLMNYDIFAIPKGWRTEIYNDNFGEYGKRIIRNYIKQGGIYVGIDRGAHFATKAYLNLYPGGYVTPVPGIRYYDMVNVNINKDSLWLDLKNIPSRLTTLYLNGGYFEKTDALYEMEIQTIAKYSQNNMPCMVAFKYGYGSVFLSSLHPEVEEDSFRDGYFHYDYFEDPESEWDLALIISLWLLNPLRPVIFVVMDIVGGAVCAAIFIFVLLQKYSKKRLNTNHSSENV
ncbi:MAG: hypothetical protein ACFFDF_02620 [Candidatus Odinarchaeota archaeon]